MPQSAFHEFQRVDSGVREVSEYLLEYGCVIVAN